MLTFNMISQSKLIKETNFLFLNKMILQVLIKEIIRLQNQRYNSFQIYIYFFQFKLIKQKVIYNLEYLTCTNYQEGLFTSWRRYARFNRLAFYKHFHENRYSRKTKVLIFKLKEIKNKKIAFIIQIMRQYILQLYTLDICGNRILPKYKYWNENSIQSIFYCRLLNIQSKNVYLKIQLVIINVERCIKGLIKYIAFMAILRFIKSCLKSENSYTYNIICFFTYNKNYQFFMYSKLSLQIYEQNHQQSCYKINIRYQQQVSNLFRNEFSRNEIIRIKKKRIPKFYGIIQEFKKANCYIFYQQQYEELLKDKQKNKYNIYDALNVIKISKVNLRQLFSTYNNGKNLVTQNQLFEMLESFNMQPSVRYNFVCAFPNGISFQDFSKLIESPITYDQLLHSKLKQNKGKSSQISRNYDIRLIEIVFNKEVNTEQKNVVKSTEIEFLLRRFKTQAIVKTLDHTKKAEVNEL
ncbi:unnamed protein product [Paramecium sonneborni]|uniref:Uncharacterized protein n=1 Tax=Paramecium sonneborni TaxID=65129 RepID=A0A8S1PN70_9CILI|nr:unnamed protein product [Paramecium sonneborni]